MFCTSKPILCICEERNQITLSNWDTRPYAPSICTEGTPPIACHALRTSSWRRSLVSPRGLHPLESIWDGNEVPPGCICTWTETVGVITLGVKKTNKGVSRDLSETLGSCKTYVATYWSLTNPSSRGSPFLPTQANEDLRAASYFSLSPFQQDSKK